MNQLSQTFTWCRKWTKGNSMLMSFFPKQKAKKQKGFACSLRHLGFNPLWWMCTVLCVHSSLSVACVCAEALSDKCSAQYICMLHYDPHPSISVSFPPQLKLFHLSFSLQQSTNSLSCQSKPTFMQPIINDTIHLAWSLSLSSALFLFHPLSLEWPREARLPFNVTYKVSGLTRGSCL